MLQIGDCVILGNGEVSRVVETHYHRLMLDGEPNKLEDYIVLENGVEVHPENPNIVKLDYEFGGFE